MGTLVKGSASQGAGGSKSKWLKDDGDDDWGRKVGLDNYKAENQGFQTPNFSSAGTPQRDFREKTTLFANIPDKSSFTSNNLKHRKGISKNSVTDGLDSKEQYGLNLEEIKRQRSEAHDSAT